MSTNENVFRFELNETLFFKRGHEVSEMVGISLDPNISVTPFNDYISIKGYITLQGDYKKNEREEDAEEETSLEGLDFHARPYLDDVEENEEGLTTFTYQFPIEITVPTYRVNNLDDITVEVDEFDYELPNEERLSLTAALKINGINDDPDLAGNMYEKSQGEIEEQFEFEVIKKTEEEDESSTPLLESFLKDEHNISEDKSRADDQFMEEEESIEDVDYEISSNEELTHELEVIEEEESEAEPLEAEREVEYTIEESLERTEDEVVTDYAGEQEEPEETEEAEEDEKERIFLKKQSKKLSDYFKELAEKDKKEDETTESVDLSEEENEYDDSYKNVETEDVNQDEEYDYSKMENVPAEDINYLTDIFRGVEEEERFAQMRICIVQENDTLETIAERYDVSKVQLLKKNQLENGELREGQLLNIPIKRNKTNISGE